MAPTPCPTARNRSIGHESAANRRPPVIGTFSIVAGAWNGRPAESRRTALPASRVATPATPATSRTAAGTAFTAVVSSSLTPFETPPPVFFPSGRFAHTGGAPRRSGSVDIVLASSDIAATPSTTEWWIFV